MRSSAKRLESSTRTKWQHSALERFRSGCFAVQHTQECILECIFGNCKLLICFPKINCFCNQVIAARTRITEHQPSYNARNDSIHTMYGNLLLTAIGKVYQALCEVINRSDLFRLDPIRSWRRLHDTKPPRKACTLGQITKLKRNTKPILVGFFSSSFINRFGCIFVHTSSSRIPYCSTGLFAHSHFEHVPASAKQTNCTYEKHRS